MMDVFFGEVGSDEPVQTRRKLSTKDCPECLICSDEVFEVNLAVG